MQVKTSVALLCGALLLAGCAGAPAERESDAVIAGQRYDGTPVNLGAVKMRLSLRESAPPQGGTSAPENARLSLGFLAAAGSARVLVGGATLRYGERTAELVTREQAQGDAQGCVPDGGGAMLALDYWFAATVTADAWNCVTLAFVTPGRRAGDELELHLGTLNVDGELVHTLPVGFVPRDD
jgi:hypothetical protein